MKNEDEQSTLVVPSPLQIKEEKIQKHINRYVESLRQNNEATDSNLNMFEVAAVEKMEQHGYLVERKRDDQGRILNVKIKLP